jgi:hypothetical protein
VRPSPGTVAAIVHPSIEAACRLNPHCPDTRAQDTMRDVALDSFTKDARRFKREVQQAACAESGPSPLRVVMG